MTLLEREHSHNIYIQLPRTDLINDMRPRTLLWLCLGILFILLGLIIIGATFPFKAGVPSLQEETNTVIETIIDNHSPYITVEDLKILPLWTKVTILKILPKEKTNTKQGLIYWESLVSFKCAILGETPNIISEVPLLPNRGFLDMDRQVLEANPHLNLYHPNSLLDQSNKLCSLWEPFKIHSIRQSTILRGNFSLYGTNYKLNQHIRSRYEDWPSTQFATTWLSISAEEEGCYMFEIYDRLEGVITGRSYKDVTIHLSSSEEPLVIIFREPKEKCFSPKGNREIFWEQSGFFFHIKLVISDEIKNL